MTQVPDDGAPAPQIPGYTYVRPIGHGGFSDVYLYEQTMPRRQVAIKVLRTDDLSEPSRQQFADEANLMARVSNHSNIAAIFAADVDDDGQPYLVMEYCSGGSLGAFYRHYPMSVKDVLSLGIRLSGALEAAHRAGIVHRDIKPANILLTEYGVPVLSDFGISTIDEEFPEHTRPHASQSQRAGTGESSVGMSLPWAAPETLWDVPVSDARSDRYSLAATLYSLLEGRSPHEVPGGPNSAAHLTGRIQTGFIGAMKRPDVPPSLQAILRKGLSHDRAGRYDSAAQMGLALQDVQRELGFEVTPLEVPRGGAPSRPPAPTTRVHQSQPIQLPDGHVTLAPPADGVAPVAGSAPGPQPHQQAAAAAPPSQPWSAAQTHGAASQGPMVMAGAPPPSGSRTRWSGFYVALISVLLVGVVVVASLLIARAVSGPSYDGRAVDHLEATPNSAGVYQVTIPDGLPIPDDVQSRVLTTGDGDPLSDAYTVDISTDTSPWLDGETVPLNPRETVNHNEQVNITTDELGAALGVDVTTLHGGDILLVAAPVGYFANTHPEMGINASDATVVVVEIIEVY